MSDKHIITAEISVDDSNPNANEIKTKRILCKMLGSEIAIGEKATISLSEKQPQNGLTKYEAKIVVLSVEEYENLIGFRNEK